jgi:hypothetical protein
MRIAIFASVLATSAFAGQPAGARSVVQTATARTDSQEQPILNSQEVLNRLGIQRPATSDLLALSQQIAQKVQSSGALPNQNKFIPGILRGDAALSAAILTNLNSSTNSNYRDVLLMADADGTEDMVSDHWTKVDDLSNSELPDGWTLTRGAISEHTVANGFTSTVYYYGDSVGNIYMSADTGENNGQVVTTTVLNLPSYYKNNKSVFLSGDDQIVVTGLAINPVADLTAFAEIDNDYDFFGKKTGEILYVSFWDTGIGLQSRMPELNNSKIGLTETIKSGVIAIPIADDISPELQITSEAKIISPQGFPVTIGEGYPVVFSTFSNIAGIAVDDNGDLYFQQVDLENFSGANITKISSYDWPTNPGWQDRALVVRTNSGMFLNTLSPENGFYGYSAAPDLNRTTEGINLITNYSGMSSTWGNVVALAAGPNNILYAALARSLNLNDQTEVQNTEGLFVNPDLLGPTPSMIVSLADTSGAFKPCAPQDVSSQGTSLVLPGINTVPNGDGIADVAQGYLPLIAGVTNFRTFVLGNGPDVRDYIPSTSVTNTLQLDMQIDYTIYSGLAVDEESKVYVISGGTPASVGLNPSPSRGEILVFPDTQPFDRRADAIDLRGNVVPSQPNIGTDVGNGVVNRYDYLFYQAPTDQLSFTPIGLSGLSRGFLLYLNRARTWTENSLDSLPPGGRTQASEISSGPLYFGDFDPSNQIAGGDDDIYPYRGDDYGNAGSPVLTDTEQGGFEFIYRQYISETNTLSVTAWNAFYLNPSGNLTFGGPDNSINPSVENFLNGLPKIAGAWTPLDTGSRWDNDAYNTFPLQALGFAGVNHFIVRWINVPSGKDAICGSSNSFSISLYDDGTGKDENLTEATRLNSVAMGFDLQEGPTNLRYVKDSSDTLTGYNPRKEGSGNICLTYGHMDLLGNSENHSQAIAGVSSGVMSVPPPPPPPPLLNSVATVSIPGTNLSQAAILGDKPFPWPLGVPIGPNVPGTLFNSPVMPFEYFGNSTPGLSSLPVLTSTFDLRQEGNDPVLSTPLGQPDLNRGQVCFYMMNYTVLLPVVNR